MFPIVLDVFGIFLDVFGNIIFDILLVIFMLVGVILGLLFRPRIGNMVLKLLVKEHRFYELPIEEETAVSVECSPQKGLPAHRFLKYAPGYNGVVGKFVRRMRTLFLGKEGTAYTWHLEGDKKVESTLTATLLTLWGKKFYDLIPDEQKQKVEEAKINVTVDLESGLTPEGYRPITEEDIHTEEDRKAAETFWEGKKRLDSGQWLKIILPGLAGFGLAFVVLVLFGKI
jgi:hypothetical protein